MDRIALGKAGEEMVSQYLLASGYRILARGYRNKCGEIDIIAQQGRTIHFIEVKTRTSNNFGWPAESVNSKKIRHIRNVANIFINSKERQIKNELSDDLFNMEYVIDVVEVSLNHIQGVE